MTRKRSPRRAKNIFNRFERLPEDEEEEKPAAGFTRDGDDRVPPGYVRVVDAQARPEPIEAGEGTPAGPRVRGL